MRVGIAHCRAGQSIGLCLLSQDNNGFILLKFLQ